MFITSYSVTYCIIIYIPGKPEFCFHYNCAVYGACTYLDAFWLADRVRLHYTISLSSLFKLIWTNKVSLRYILSSDWVRWSIFSQLSIIQSMGLCVLVNPFALWWWRKYSLCLIIIIKSEIWTIIHCLRLGHETMECAVFFSIFLRTTYISNQGFSYSGNIWCHQIG